MDTTAQLIILRLENSLRARKYSPATRQRYLGFCQQLFQYYPTMKPAELGAMHLEAFLADLERQGRSASCINQAISAFSYLWTNILALPFPITARPRANQVMPIVLSPKQVENLMTIKDLMGHQSLATLQRYVHLAAASSGASESPFDAPPHGVVKGN